MRSRGPGKKKICTNFAITGAQRSDQSSRLIRAFDLAGAKDEKMDCRFNQGCPQAGMYVLQSRRPTATRARRSRVATAGLRAAADCNYTRTTQEIRGRMMR